MELACLPHAFVPVLAEADRAGQVQIERFNKYNHNLVR